MRVVGLTGGIATGKSTVARMLRERHDVPVIDMDRIARQVVEPGEPAYDQVVERFGDEVVQPDGTLDRGRLRGIIAHDADARRDLEQITHPAIRRAAAERLAELAEAGAPAAVVEAALLVETGSHEQYPYLIVVSCDRDTQLQRLLDRDAMDRDDAEALVEAQLPVEDKEAVATHVIRNDGSLDELAERVDQVWADIEG